MSERQMHYLPLAVLKTEGAVIPYDLYPIEEIALGFTITRERFAAEVFNAGYMATPHIWIPKPVELVATAAALAIVTNPVVTRRFWQGWGSLGK